MKISGVEYGIYKSLRNMNYSKEEKQFIMRGIKRTCLSGEPYSEKINREMKASECTFSEPKETVEAIVDYISDKENQMRIKVELRNWASRSLIERIIFP